VSSLGSLPYREEERKRVGGGLDGLLGLLCFSLFSSLAKLLLLFSVLLDAFGTKKGTERGIRKGFRSGFKDFQN
jgi:hypothetical protein